MWGGNAEYIMRGGGIEGNTAVSKDGLFGGGGVYVDPKASFTMYDGVMQNNSTGGSGGGVYAQTGAVFTMHDGVIQNNTAAGTDTLNSGGGGVYANGTFDMLGGAIKGNTALNGGGVSIYKKSTLSGGTVSGNTATANGGGVFIYADCALSGTAIESNKGETGGGVYLWGGTSTLSGSAIRWNTAKNGGGAYIYLGFCDFKSGTVSGNTATANGGGVYIDNQLFMTGGTISGNTAAGAGGGVYIDAKARGFRLDYAPVIKDNVTGGTIANGLLTGGTANNVYLPDGKTITTDNLRDGADIRVTTATAPTAARPVAITDVQTKDFSAFFTSDDPAFGTRSRRQGATMGDGQYVELALPAVEVSHDGGVHYTGYVSYENGWQDAVGNNNTADTVVRLLEDWPAYADAENTTSFGYGAGFGAGNIHVPETRPSRST